MRITMLETLEVYASQTDKWPPIIKHFRLETLIACEKAMDIFKPAKYVWQLIFHSVIDQLQQ